MGRALGVTEFLAKKFDVLEFDSHWLESYDRPERNFSAMFYGESGNGKTEYTTMFAKYLTKFGSVLYNSIEQGSSRSLQASWERQGMHEVKGRITLADRESYGSMILRLKKKNSPNFVIIDSTRYMRLTYDMWQELRGMFKKKSFILIAHGSGDNPKSYSDKEILFDVDIKVQVKAYQAIPRCRFGGNKPYIFYQEGHDKLVKQAKKTGTSGGDNVLFGEG
jgi:hypothetical protein